MANKVDVEVNLIISKAMSSIRKLNSQLKNSVDSFNKNNTAVSKIKNGLTASNNVLNNLVGNSNKLHNGFKRASNSTSKMKNDLKRSDVYAKTMAESATQISKVLAGIALGTQFIKAAETYASAVNKLNNINSQSLGNAGITNVNGVSQYSQATQDMTKKDLDKIFASAQSARTDYGSMVGNVGKQALLAGDAFGNNIDNVIKFNELLAKSYAISGATTEEQLASMTQLTQALGAGVLQGDELRSVREGASIAYQAIEKFAQKVYDTDESLKELGSQGLITSELVVAAILENANAIDQAMELSSITVGQFWTLFKNSAFYAFSDTFSEFNKFLAKLSQSVIYETILRYIAGIAKAFTFALKLANVVLDFIEKHEAVLKPIIQGLILLLSVGLTGALLRVQFQTLKVILSFMSLSSISLKKFSLLLGVLGAIYGAIYLISGGALNANAQIVSSLLATASILIAIKVLLLGFSNPILFIGGLAVSVLLGIMAKSIITKNSVIEGLAEVISTFAGVFAFIKAGFKDVVQIVIKLLDMKKKAFGMCAQNIKRIWDNLIQDLNYAWQSFLSGVTNGKYEVRTKHVNLFEGVSSVQDLLSSLNNINLDSPMSAYFSTKDSVYKSVVDKLKQVSDIGSNIGGNLSLGPDGTGLNYQSPDISDMLGNISDTADNTDKISNDLKLITQDLSFLKDLAELEWKKEFTTANINVSMTNNNNVSDKNDIGDIATILKTQLQTELKTVASGTYS